LIRHKLAFAKLEKKTLRKNTFRALTHDLDKLLFYVFTPMPIEWIRKRHKLKARHHNPKNKKDLVESMIDYECARMTKPKSTMTAHEYVLIKFKNKPEEIEKCFVILKELGFYDYSKDIKNEEEN